VTIPETPSIGELGKITVTGHTGTVGLKNVLFFSPVTADTWPVDNFEFIDSVIVLEGYPNTPYKNVAKIPESDVAANTDDRDYTETFTFVINGEGSASTTPSNYIASGQPVKHTTNDSGSFDVIIPPGECPIITVTPDTLSDGTIGAPYGPVYFFATADEAGYGNYEFTSSNLPAWLSLSSDGELTGTPTTGGTFNFTVTATDTLNESPEDCSGQVTVSLTVNCPIITVGPGSLSAGTIDTPYSDVQFTASGGSGSYTFELDGDLPSGMGLSADGLLSGTPTEPGTFPITVSAIDTETGCIGSVSPTLSIASGAPIPTLSELGMIIFSLLLGGSAMMMMRRRKEMRT